MSVVEVTLAAVVVYIQLSCVLAFDGEMYCIQREIMSSALLKETEFETKDCQHAFEKGERKSGATYILRPDPNWKLVRAVCQFDHESGWTVIQRRLDGSVDFYRGWDEYVEGFGATKGEYWMGLEAIHYFTKTNQRLSIYLESHDGEVRTAKYSSFYIEDSSTDYLNHASGYSGDAGDSLTGGHNHNNMKFTTFDKDNDLSDSNCAEKYHGAWWYRSCHSSNLNGIWYEGGTTSSRATGAVWYSWKGHNYSMKTIYMRLSHQP
ncbi:angiopoietin-related protein 2-like [Watersipora subatra]|uniref:angiopoietin-related protein 2-like n=1 Tax=Watersipora subatra TaxID=2589382 RepID=UPI00355C2D35